MIFIDPCVTTRLTVADRAEPRARVDRATVDRPRGLAVPRLLERNLGTSGNRILQSTRTLQTQQRATDGSRECNLYPSRFHGALVLISLASSTAPRPSQRSAATAVAPSAAHGMYR